MTTYWNGYIHIQTAYSLNVTQQQAIGIAYAALTKLSSESKDQYTVRASLDNSQFILEGAWDIDALKAVGLQNLINGIEQGLGLPLDTLWNTSQVTFLGLGLDKEGFAAGIDAALAADATWQTSRQAALALIRGDLAAWQASS